MTPDHTALSVRQKAVRWGALILALAVSVLWFVEVHDHRHSHDDYSVEHCHVVPLLETLLDDLHGGRTRHWHPDSPGSNLWHPDNFCR